MLTLNSIELSNIRRFSTNVKIEVGPGATILLAPNGTGKTAVFEAIELALTGNVNRLGEDFIPLIKDGENLASVRLNFTKWSREVSVTERGIVEVVPGELDALFPGVDPQHYPYLLRLTHLLDQRGKQWFLQGTSEEAGQQLSRLPLGREASQIFQKMVPIKRALTQEKTDASAQLDKFSTSLGRWESLVSSRTESLSSVKPLKSLEEILLLVGANGSGLTGTTSADMGYVREELGSIRNAVNQKLTTSQQKLSRLVDFFPQLNRHKELLDNKSSSEVAIGQKLAALASLKQDVELLNQKISTNEALLIRVASDCSKAIKRSEKVEFLGRERSKIVGLKSLFDELVVLKELNEEKKLSKNTVFQELKDVVGKHSYVSVTFEYLTQQELKLLTAREALAQLKGASQDFLRISELIEELQSSAASSDSRLSSIVLDVKEAAIKLGEARALLEDLASLEGKLKAALAQLSTCVDPDSDDCPVCKSHVGAAHIRDSLAAASLAVGPQYLIASKNHDDLALDLAAKRTAMELEESSRALLSAKLDAALREQSIAQSKIDLSYSNELIQGQDIAGATQLLEHLSDELDRKRYELEAEKKALPVVSPQDVLQSLESEIQSIEIDGDRIDSRLKEAEIQIASGTTKIVDLEMELSEIEVSEELSILEDRRATLAAQIVDDIEQQTISSQKHSVEEKGLQLIKDSVSENNKAITRIEAEWDDLGFDGLPALEAATASQLILTQETHNAENELISIGRSQDELARWGWHVESEKLQNQIDSLRGDLSESAYRIKTLGEIEHHANRVNKVERVRSALEDFSSKLKSEIETVQEKIATVVPLWRTLLNRIVREPRFGKTDLTYISERNRSKARVHVKLGTHEVAVANVASEAQMTDIQLAFLLSMSLTHSWSPWKALLLDDPTQHHDLVHSASVFDLLRDFISDHGYQVVIATHDAAQARFFLRKLLNDGIEARIVNLQPSDEGVIVKSM
ncbi:AAA family ATPase [Pseudomonas sp. Ant30-3]|uniref:AAA family ATPase n=1 Tax=Pseudomonas sp. Ant30-3 TaxID=1488328 RepID=UPI0004904287|nr:AAA family ATPase [Pseudomonas sp. Ant30-3]